MLLVRLSDVGIKFATITPSSSSNKILILVDLNGLKAEIISEHG